MTTITNEVLLSLFIIYLTNEYASLSSFALYTTYGIYLGTYYDFRPFAEFIHKNVSENFERMKNLIPERKYSDNKESEKSLFSFLK